MPEGFNSDVIRYCEISKKLTWTEKAPICKGTVNVSGVDQVVRQGHSLGVAIPAADFIIR